MLWPVGGSGVVLYEVGALRTVAALPFFLQHSRLPGCYNPVTLLINVQVLGQGRHSQLRFDGVVPLGQGFMALQSPRGELVGSWLEVARIVAAIQVSSDGKAGLSFCGRVELRIFW